jgi:hypothetical protein
VVIGVCHGADHRGGRAAVDGAVGVRVAHAVDLDVGQGEAPWVVLADPEGNEFCVLGAE